MAAFYHLWTIVQWPLAWFFMGVGCTFIGIGPQERARVKKWLRRFKTIDLDNPDGT